MGPANASARAATLPDTSARQEARSPATSKSIGTTSIPTISGCPQIADSLAGTPPACPTKDRLQRFLLLLVSSAIDEKASPKAGCLPGPEVARKCGHQHEF